LYGATDRSYGDIGAHYWLTDKICSRAKQHGFVDFDLLGIAPFGYPKHHLAGVSRFKQSFGGGAISYLGNFDYIFNPLLYNAFKILKQ
jgi:peptidoglycan pentaglycine glycine transferase (the first glycine)